MAKKKEQGNFTQRHRAICDEGDFKGDWHSDIQSARDDARSHRQEPGTKTHVIHVVTEQSLSVMFEDSEDLE